MVELGEYALEPLRKDEEFILYRGQHRSQDDADPPSVLLLAPVLTRPALETLKKIEHEYSFRSELDATWAVRPLAVSHYNDKSALVLEDPGGEPLNDLILGPMEMREFLRLAIALANALGHLHKRHLIHKDVKPSNILVEPIRGHLWLTGFGIASRLARERQSPEAPEFIAGTLAYMAPEQTGRMNRSIDSRSDLYALGVTFYQMLTGSLPFIASDPMEWVHCHVARRPVPPDERMKDVPAMVSAIVMKLLAKTPEERYQTAAGLERDLRRCLEEWESEHRINEFVLGEHDIPDRLVIPEKLYGRETEIETLLAAFDRIVAGGRPELVLVSGYSGSGKSSVVYELNKALVPPRGLFVSGKFDQYKRDIPYATLAQAFQGLIRPLLSKSEKELAKWRGALQEALGPNGQLMVGLVPELKVVIGDQAPVGELPLQEAQARFHMVFRRFISIFARPEHPLALFLDDLQWLDAATLDLMEDLLTQSDVKHLLLIGAYRDNEVDPTHPLIRRLQAMRQAGGILQDIILAPLGREDLEHLIADSLHCQTDHAAPLGELISDKTGGNPFFVIQFLSELAEEGLLVFDYGERRWSWNLSRIHGKGYTDNVVELMVGKLKRLPIETQKVLQVLACLGNSIDFATLRILYQDSIEEVHGQLWEAVRTGLIFRSEDSYRFLHDRVQEAAYSFAKRSARLQMHLGIGMLLATQTPPEKLEERIFEIVNQLNRGSDIASAEERRRTTELNLIAGRRAKNSTAYGSALKYLAAGRALLTEHSWDDRYDLIFAIEFNMAECEFLTGELVTAADRLTKLLARAANTIEKAAVACLLVDVCTTLDQSERAVDVCLDYLRHLGVEWSPHPTKEIARREYERIWSQLGSREIAELLDLPLMSDPASLATLQVLTKLVSPAWYSDVNLISLATCRAVNLSIENGNSDASCVAYVWLGAIAGPHFDNYKIGFRFGWLGHELVEKRGLKRFQARTYLCFGNLVMPWTKHLQAGGAMLRRAFEAANEIGDLTVAAYSCDAINTNLLAAGAPLAATQVEAENGLAFAQNARFGIVIDIVTAQLELIRTLRGLTPKFGSFDDGEFDELRFERHLASEPVLRLPECWYWIRKLQARFVAGDYSSAVAASVRAQRLLWTSPSLFETAEYHFYGALSQAACCDSTADTHFEALTVHQRQLAIWAENCPENFGNRAALVDAEIARIEGRDVEAMSLYEQAIRSAGANGFVHNEAIANEVAARFYAARGFDKIACAYLRDARYGYLRWGADGKVRQLDDLYPDLRDEKPAAGSTSTIGSPVERLDLATVIKVSQAVSSETVLEKLIDTFMRSAIEHAGAERGLLILPRGDELRIEAEATTGGTGVIVRQREAAVSALPESIVHFVTRIQECVILGDAATHNNPFSADTYIQQRHARSLLCLPLMNQAKLVGVLYLENNLAPHVFTPTRITVLKLLASQAAISLENARLYVDLGEREAKIRQSEKELRQLLDLTPQHLRVLAADGSLVYANEVALRYHGVTMDQLKQQRPLAQWRADEVPLTCFHPDDRERVMGELKDKFLSGCAHETEVRLLKYDGTYRWFLIRRNPIRDEQGRVIRWYAAATDIEERKQAEQRLQNENVALREEIDRASMFEEIVGISPALHAVLSRVSKVAPTDSTVLIMGETGTGKELIARAVHKRSQRSSRAFVSVNCAATPRDLIASELFGHEKGAFTGATQRRLGRFELAEGGTIFLDEIGELPAETQIALLRVLQEHEFGRVGGTGSIRTDARVIAATNRDLEVAIAAGTFRSDLFYRLNVFPIEVPPLRKRREDIPVLVEYFIDRYARKAGKSIRGVNKKSLEMLQSYPWPGNIRELQNVIERSVIVCDTENFSVDESWLSRQPGSTGPKSQLELSQKLASQEKEMIEVALRESAGRVSGPSGAAAKLGIPGSTLYSKIASLRIDKNRFKTTNSSKDHS